MKRINLLSAICLVSIVSSCSDNEPEPLPEVCPPPLLSEDVLVSSSAYYNRWVDAGGEVELHSSTEVSSPSGAKVIAYKLEVDDIIVGEYDYPLTSGIVLDAADYGHGSHKLTLYAVVEDSLGRQVSKPTLENNHFVVFDVIPDIDIAASLDVHVTSVATSGEKYDEQFTVESTADGRLRLPKDKFSWIPSNGSASGLDVNMTISTRYSELPEGFEGTIESEQWNLASEESVAGNAVKLHWSNPVKFEEWHGLTPSCLLKYKGTYEGIELNDSTINGFVVVLE